MDERAAIAWLTRSAGFGATPEEFDAALDRGAAAELDRRFQPAPLVDPWDDDRVPFDPRDQAATRHAVDGWSTLMATTTTPLVDRIAWFWHGHFVSSLDKVRTARLLVEQARRFRSLGTTDFRSLVRAVSVDPAMLVYLDGRTSTAAAPNENYARELMELFTLGVGQYEEADVAAAAAALTGWTLGTDSTARFRDRRHDDTPRRFLGVEGVHDLDSVIDAVLAHPAAATFVTTQLCWELLGTAPDDLVADLASRFGTDWALAPLIRSILEAGLRGTRATLVIEPARWLAMAERVTQVQLPPRLRLTGLRAAGQIPFAPPNVAGWPGGAPWCSTAATVARANLAAQVASAVAPGHRVLLAAEAGPDELALTLGLGAPFGRATAAALRTAPGPTARLALALSSPEYVLL